MNSSAHQTPSHRYQQEPIPEAGIADAVKVLRSGRLHRYNVDDGEWSQTALLEKVYAGYQGVKYCIAFASGGYALHIALRSAGLNSGDKVLAKTCDMRVPLTFDESDCRLIAAVIDEVLDCGCS